MSDLITYEKGSRKERKLCLMQFNRFKRYFQILIIFSFAVLMTIFLGGIEILAVENLSTEIPDFIPQGTIILDEQSSEKISYVSPDQGVFIFRDMTPQLEKLQSGDVLLINPIEEDVSYLLFEIIHIIKGKSNSKGIMIEVIPWKNHPPFISSLVAQPYTLRINDSSNLICYAADEDGDVLHYIWSVSGGIISGDGPNITWTAPNQTGNYEITCEVIDSSGDKNSKSILLSVVKNMPLLTSQERELLKNFGWGGNRTIRWPDKYIEVFDTTNFNGMQEVLDEWNHVVGEKVNFRLSDNPYSPVKISYDHKLREQKICGHIDTHWRNYQLNKAEITINPDFSFCGFPEDNFGLYLHLFAGIAGFDAWKGTTVERREWQEFTLIPDIMQRMIKALYKIPAGYDLDRDL